MNRRAHLSTYVDDVVIEKKIGARGTTEEMSNNT